MKQLQITVRDFCKKNNLAINVEHRFIDLVSEVGELGKEWLLATNYAQKSFVCSNNFRLEFGDVLFSLLCIANQADLDIEDCLRDVLTKYEKRLINGTPGSRQED